MAWDPTLYSVVGIAAAALLFVVAAAGWQHRTEPGAKAFIGLITALGAWALVYGIQLGFTTLDAQLAWQRVALAIGGPVPTLWFLFAVQYTNRDAWLTRPVRAIMLLDSAVFGLLTLTNPSHGLVWHDASLVSYGTLQALDIAFGPGYLLHIAYTYVVTPIGFGLLAVATLRSTLYRAQAGLLVVGAIPPLVANAAFSLGLRWTSLPPVDFTPFAFVITGPCFALALFRFDLLERVPVARRKIVADADDGFVVLDEDERIVTFNPSAARLLDDPIEGRPLREHLPAGSDGATLTALDGTTLTAVVGQQQRVYDVTCSTLSDHHDRVVGYVLRYRNVTDRHRYEKRLKVANRVLRHNLRNRMNVIIGWAEELRERDDPEVAAAGERITTTAVDLVELGSQVRLLVETADDVGETTERVVLRDHLEPLLNRLRESHPQVAVEADLPSTATAVVPSAKLLVIAVENLLQNAVEHNDAERPWVRLVVEDDGEHTRIRVADNGPGIPDDERAVLRRGSETPLEHGSGLGLWLVHWTVTAAGGEVSFGESDADGSVITLTLPSGTDGGAASA
ncbi:histidine kinase N-terminal 7TM domain-containing protein [Haloplanus salinarum]|uniref:histidine kinase N-terminal 7TM domain-containing protein n=1 Tax=Haloplanus salinarum TaxID=1912324 RepID=UPI00214CEBE5|nr:histidine kinase N-terminal 7TM domain-containing protein [Haloplanus salinarum]